MERFFFSVGNNANVMKMASLAQFSVSGAPIVYYDDESGLSQDRPGQFDPARKRMQWGSGAPQGWNGPINQDAHNFYKLLTRVRGAYRALRRGNYVPLYRNNETDTIAWGRYFPDANPASVEDDSVIVVMILHPGRQTITLPNQSGFGTNLAVDLKLAIGSTVLDKVSGQTFGVQNGKITLSLDSQGSAILVRQR